LVISCSNCLIKHFIEENIQRKIEDDEDDLNSHGITLRKEERILGIERGSARSHCMEKSLWKRLKAGYVMNE
jgi:hypothetical protein